MSRIQVAENPMITIFDVSSDNMGLGLTKDGPSEIILKKLKQFEKDNDTSKKAFVEAFINEYMEMNKISRAQLAELISSLNDADAELLDNALVRKRKQSVRGGFCLLLLAIVLFVSTGVGLWYGNTLGLVGVWKFLLRSLSIVGLIFFGLGILAGIFTLIDSFDSAGGSKNLSNYRWWMKRKFGQDYFPIQELRKELGV